MRQQILLASLTAALAMSTACQAAQYPVAYQAPPPPTAYGQHELKVFDRGFREGYWAGRENRGGSGAPNRLTNDMGPDSRAEFRRGYRDGFHRGQADRHAGAPWLYPRS
jgi:hypothetical protein